MDFSSGYTLVANALSNWPTDWIIIGAIAAFAALDALRNGGNRAIALVLALPAALLALEALPNAAFVGTFSAQFSTRLLQALLFGIVFVALYVFTYRILGFWSGTSGGPMQALITGVAGAAVLTTVWISVPALDSFWTFGPQVHTVFGEAYRFWWLVLSFVGLAFARS